MESQRRRLANSNGKLYSFATNNVLIGKFIARETRLGGSAPSIKEEQAMREQRNSMHVNHSVVVEGKILLMYFV